LPSPCCTFIPGGIVGAGVADASGTGGPGFIVGGGGVGAIVMPGIGAIVGAGDAFAGTGVLLCSGAGVIRMPGMGAMVGSAATPGAAVRTIENVTTAMRVASKVASAVRIGVREMPRERPRMAFQVRCLITAVTPRLIGKFHHDSCARGDCCTMVRIDVVDVSVEHAADTLARALAVD
jgi:hypothetical protein